MLRLLYRERERYNLYDTFSLGCVIGHDGIRYMCVCTYNGSSVIDWFRRHLYTRAPASIAADNRTKKKNETTDSPAYIQTYTYILYIGLWLLRSDPRFSL